jgi:hypothetical protein
MSDHKVRKRPRAEDETPAPPETPGGVTPSSVSISLQKHFSRSEVEISTFQKALDHVAASKPKAAVLLKGLAKRFLCPVNECIQESDDSTLLKKRVADLIQWKLSRGVFRPGLLQKFLSNSEATVQASVNAARLEMMKGEWETLAAKQRISRPTVPTLMAALRHLSALQGVGPATGTLILAHMSFRWSKETDRHVQGLCPFMSDEAMKMCDIPLVYTVSNCEAFIRFIHNVQLSLDSCCVSASNEELVPSAFRISEWLWASCVLKL